MKHLKAKILALTAVALLFLHLSSLAQINQWTWMGGSNTANQYTANTGVRTPGARSAAVRWKDASGNLWVFGGYGYSGSTYGYLNDLWKFNPASSQWTWVGGSITSSTYGSYGTQGTAAATNWPGCRYYSTSWVDASGNFWLFGGTGYAASTAGSLNDLWMYNPNTGLWTWMGGSNASAQAGNYGTKGTAAATNWPGARYNSYSWTDANGNFWIFGGSGLGSTTSSGYLNDLWMYTPATKQWTWQGGNNLANQVAVYGTKGTPAATNWPGGHSNGTSWSDGVGNLWLFGGQGYGVANPSTYNNDFWKYNIASGQWTWMGGSTSTQYGTYGTQGTPGAANMPGSRFGCTGWTDAGGSMYLYGGSGYASSTIGALNDLWKYNPVTNQWTWISGSNLSNQISNYGTQGTTASTNIPGGRQQSILWIDGSGKIWLFGGSSSATGITPTLNDLWVYNPDTNQWTWTNGSSTTNQTGNYGIPGNPTITRPGGRYGSALWKDADGNFWIFGGNGYATGSSGSLNDLWKYNPSSDQWTWMGGSSAPNQMSNYGIQGSASTSNWPGSRYGSTYWTDASGNFWLFGGNGYATSTFGYLNDLWMYNPLSGQWTWMGGSSIPNQVGNYGTQGSAAASNIPGARRFSNFWVDASGNVWIFGGNGYAATGSGSLNDLWMYNTSTGQWTWIGGSSTPNQYGTYGVQNITDPSNMPGGRYNSVSWTDVSGNFWLFGGSGYASGTSGMLNDLWKYSPVSNQWTWMSGSNMPTQYGNYGIMGSASATNMPGSRAYSVSWADVSGNLWLFGGNGYASSTGGNLNDLWVYNPSTSQWTWMYGSSAPAQYGSYGVQNMTDPSNTPGARQYSTSWTDASGNFWLFGGIGNAISNSGNLNDVWKFAPQGPVSSLPLHFLSFKAAQKGSNVQLEWITAEEEPGTKYEWQRSANGQQFTTLGSVLASVASGNKVYQALDAQPSQGKNYYRIRSVGPSGEVVYSSITVVNTESVKTSVNVYPNPVSGNTFSLQLNGLVQGKYVLNIYDASGQSISTQVINHRGGYATQTITFTSPISKGVYQLTLKGVNSKYVCTLIKN